jgi:hypothetical protein
MEPEVSEDPTPTLKADPMRVNERRLNEDPTLIKSNVLTLLPNRPKLLNDTVEPRAHIWITESCSMLPKRIWPKTEACEPKRM